MQAPILIERARTPAAVILALGLVGAAWLLGASAARIADSRGTLAVTGSAHRQVRADLAVWRGTLSTQAPTLRAASAQLAWCRERVREYLVARGLAAGDTMFSAVSTEAARGRGAAGEGAAGGFRLSQGVEVRSADVARVAAAERGAGALLDLGVPFESQAPEFLCAGSAGMEAEVLGLATRDARARALAMARQGGGRLGRLRSARIEAFRITPAGGRGAAPMVEVTAAVAASFEVR
ncbi:MAG: SIMPL domain-containing protein [Candidatus Eisenbacteria bacterium]|nr:SIMPL domain-containing protein [Candidatus Eisenbacteria bacterium]